MKLALTEANFNELVSSLVYTLLSEELENRKQCISEAKTKTLKNKGNNNVATGYGPLTFLSQNNPNQGNTASSIESLVQTLQTRKIFNNIDTNTIVNALNFYKNQRGQRNIRQQVGNFIKRTFKR